MPFLQLPGRGLRHLQVQAGQRQGQELTEASYVLSDADLDQGYILACQAVPQGDVTIEVDLAAQAARRQVSGRIVGQDHLTRDITRVRVQLDEALPYKAGQFADISLASLPGVQRSYSFATPAQADAQVAFSCGTCRAECSPRPSMSKTSWVRP